MQEEVNDYISDRMKAAAEGFLNVEPINTARLYASRDERAKPERKKSVKAVQAKPKTPNPKPSNAQASLF